MKKLLIVVLLAAFLVPAFGQTPIIVAGEPMQPPYSFSDSTGLEREIAKALNSVQSKYKFTVVDLSAGRIVKSLADGTIPIAIFTNINWGFDPATVDKGTDLLASGDLFIALKSSATSQTYFDGVGKLQTVGVLGFSYKYAGFETNQDTLKSKFNTSLVRSEYVVISTILEGKGQIGIVSASMLEFYKKTEPSKYDQLLVSQNYDSKYVRSFIVSKKSPLTVKELDGFMKSVSASGQLAQIYAKYGQVPPKM